MALITLLYPKDLTRDQRADLFCGLFKPDLAFVEANYVEVGKFNYEFGDLLACEHAFELTNSPDPSDGGEFVEGVARAARHHGGTHTSLSVGDVVRVQRVSVSNDKYMVTGLHVTHYVCESMGFARIEN